MNNKTISKSISKKPASKSNKMKFKETLKKLSQLTRNRNKRENYRNTRRKQRINTNRNLNNRNFKKTIKQRGGNNKPITNKVIKKFNQQGGTISEEITKRVKSTIQDRKFLNKTFEDIIGYEDLKADLKETVDIVKIGSTFEDISKDQRTPPQKYILLYGPPGTGKTYFVNAMSNLDENAAYFKVTAGNIFGKYVGESQSFVSELFNVAREEVRKNNTFSLIFIDEGDTIFKEELEGINKEVHNIFLQEISEGSRNKGIILITASNYPELFSPASQSRFEKKYIGPPTEEDYEGLIYTNSGCKAMADGRTTTCPNITIDKIKEVAKFCIDRNFMPRDIYKLCNIANDQSLIKFVNSKYFKLTREGKFKRCGSEDPFSINKIIERNAELKKIYIKSKHGMNDDQYSYYLSSGEKPPYPIIITIEDLSSYSSGNNSNFEIDDLESGDFDIAMKKKQEPDDKSDEEYIKKLDKFIIDNEPLEKLEKILINKQRLYKVPHPLSNTVSEFKKLLDIKRSQLQSKTDKSLQQASVGNSPEPAASAQQGSVRNSPELAGGEASAQQVPVDSGAGQQALAPEPAASAQQVRRRNIVMNPMHAAAAAARPDD